MIRPFVQVIESPSPDDIFDGRTEGRLLCEALTLAGIRSRYRVATNRTTFERAMHEDIGAAMVERRSFPIIHISAHGDEDGIGLTDGTRYEWPELQEHLTDINTTLRGGLLVAMSSCFGVNGCYMAMHDDGPLPFWGIAGHSGTALWSDSAIAFVAFYHRMFKGASVEEAQAAMRAASGDTQFHILKAADARQAWLQVVEEHARAGAAPKTSGPDDDPHV
jgi:hypothetical protein